MFRQLKNTQVSTRIVINQSGSRIHPMWPGRQMDQWETRTRPLPGCNRNQEVATQLTTAWELNEGGSADTPTGGPNFGMDLNKENLDVSYPLWITQDSFMSLLFLANTEFFYELLYLKTTFFQLELPSAKTTPGGTMLSLFFLEVPCFLCSSFLEQTFFVQLQSLGEVLLSLLTTLGTSPHGCWTLKTTLFQTETVLSKNGSWRYHAVFVLPSLNKLSLSNSKLLEKCPEVTWLPQERVHMAFEPIKQPFSKRKTSLSKKHSWRYHAVFVLPSLNKFSLSNSMLVEKLPEVPWLPQERVHTVLDIG